MVSQRADEERAQREVEKAEMQRRRLAEQREIIAEQLELKARLKREATECVVIAPRLTNPS